jgi:hypothetical protein
VAGVRSRGRFVRLGPSDRSGRGRVGWVGLVGLGFDAWMARVYVESANSSGVMASLTCNSLFFRRHVGFLTADDN